MSNDAEFIKGLIVKPPHEKAPEYVKAKLSIKRAELLAWLSERDGEWINADIKVSQNGKWYAAIDNWKPNAKQDSAPRGSQSPQRGQAAAPANGGGLDDSDPIQF